MKILFLYGALYNLAWGRSQNLAKALAKLDHDVTYVDHIEPLSISNLFNFTKKPIPVGKNICVWPQVPGLPHHKWPFMLPMTALLQLIYLWRLFIGKCVYDVIIVYGVPPIPVRFQRIFLRYLRCRILLYDCADDKVSTYRDLFSENASIVVCSQEKELVKHVNAVTAINERNLERLQLPDNIPALAVGNGVDLDLFKPKRDRIIPILPYKLIYIGAINDRLNIELLINYMKKYENILEFHFYGNEHSVLDALYKMQNFVFHGSVQYEMLPDILRQYDYGLLPYRDIESIRMSFPLKTLQYLACDLPVLAFPYMNIDTFGGRVLLLDGDLPNEIPGVRVGDKKFLYQYSWTHMAFKYERFILNLTNSVVSENDRLNLRICCR